MKTLHKKILRSNTYTIPGPSPRKEVIDSARVRRWAKVGNAMLRAGLKIPAPLGHDGSTPVVIGKGGKTDEAKNAGFWTKFAAKEEVDPDTNQKHTVLYGEVQVPDELADKVGQTIQETSIYVRDKFQDGLGRHWNDAPMHVALVTQAVEPNQENFAEGSLALSMSMESDNLDDQGSSRTTEEPPPDTQGDPSADPGENLALQIGELLVQLREVARIDLPDDTLPINLAERLLAALRQKRLSEEDEDDLEGDTLQPPGKSKEPSRPIAMSQPAAPKLTPAEVEELVMAHPRMKEATQAVTNLANHINLAAQRTIKDRIGRLINSGRVAKDYAEKKLLPLAEAHKVSFADDGKEVPSPLEVILEGLEAAPAPQPALTMSQPRRTVVPGAWSQVNRELAMSYGGNMNDFELAANTNGGLSDEELDKLADELTGVSR